MQPKQICYESESKGNCRAGDINDYRPRTRLSNSAARFLHESLILLRFPHYAVTPVIFRKCLVAEKEIIDDNAR